MAASGTRHVGRVTDPLARDDGETEPELELEADVSSGERAPGEAPAPEPATEGHGIQEEIPPEPDPPEGPEAAVDGVHPVRARLLARAAGCFIMTA